MRTSPAAWALAIGLAAVAFFVPKRADACAGCSNPNLPVARADVSELRPGDVAVTMNLTATTMRVVHSEFCPEIGPICNQRAEPAQKHDQRFYVGELRPILAVGLTPGFAAEVQMPLRVIKTTITFRRLDGTAFQPDYENIHHRNETVAGFADPWLLGRGTVRFDRLTLTGRGGVGLPVGSIEEDPFARGRAGLRHQHIQLGTGTFYPVLSLDAAYELAPYRLGGYAQTVLFLYENAHGYQAGNRVLGGITLDRAFGDFRVGVSGDVLHEGAERWSGIVQQDGNVGRTDVLAGALVSYGSGPTSAALSIKVPVYQHVIEHEGEPGQLTYPALVSLSVRTIFEPTTPESSDVSRGSSASFARR